MTPSAKVVYENGNPMRWYFTGKTGEISKKRAVDMEAISLRWKRVATQSASPYVAVVKQEGGILKFLGEDAWDILLKILYKRNAEMKKKASASPTHIE